MQSGNGGPVGPLIKALLSQAIIPLEVVILLIGGTALLVAGILLFPVSVGSLPYYENGLYGLLLIIFALQIITLGKTPFGDMRRSRLVLAAGIVIAAVGIVSSFVPVESPIPRMLLILCFGPGGFLLLLQMCFAKDKLKTWMHYGGIFRHLAFGCCTVYLLSMLVALLLGKQHLLTTPKTAVVALVYSAAIFYLAGVLWKIYRSYPDAEQRPVGPVELSTDQALLMLMGVFMLLLGVLLIPVNLGMLPFSGSAQLGLLMVIFAVQMLASGSTPIGPFPRTWPVIGFGLLFAVLGIVSCIIPDILVSVLTVLIGVLNIAGGVIPLVHSCLPRLKGFAPSADPLLTRLFRVQLIMNLLAIMFGTSMLVPNLLHGLLIGVILAANGVVLLYLLRILMFLDRLQRDAGRTA